MHAHTYLLDLPLVGHPLILLMAALNDRVLGQDGLLEGLGGSLLPPPLVIVLAA